MKKPGSPSLSDTAFPGTFRNLAAWPNDLEFRHVPTDELLGENVGSLSSERQVSRVSTHNSDWTRPWNTYRFGLLLVLDRCPDYLALGR
jgi:hypothetical protein